MSSSKPKKVLIVGAGAAGMSCADTLVQDSKTAAKYEVTLIDAVNYCGGQAFSIPIDQQKYGASWLNQGVQGGSNIFHHTVRNFRRQGHDVTPVNLQVSFGKGDNFWNNVFPTKLIDKHRSEIKRFQKALKIIRWFEVFFALIPIKVSMKMFFFSDDFINFMVLPTIALFLGTGNATPDVPTIVLERIFTSPTYGMWFPADPISLASNEPPMIVFPEFSKFYSDWADDLKKRGVTIRLSTELDRVVSRDKKGVKVALRPRRPQPDNHNPVGADQDLPTEIEEYDELVLCCLADTAKEVLGKEARWIEKKVLGSAKFSDDITVTHNDHDYMNKRCTTGFDSEQAVSTLNNGKRDESERIKRGKSAYMPMYYVVPQAADHSKPHLIDLAFDTTAYQAQFAENELPFEQHVFQSIFLNKRDEARWTRDEIDKDKIIREDWWHQLCHSWTHYLFVVPWVWLLQGKNHTRFAAAWTMVNAHETATLSGTAAAYSLGAPYPEDLEKDSFALLCFRLYLFLSHGRIYKKGSHRD